MMLDADERNRLDGRRRVAKRVHLAVGRARSRRSVRSARTRRPRAAGAFPRARDRCGSPGSIRACRAYRPCGPAIGPTSSARRRPSDATSGARTIDTLSPTPPVECLSSARPAEVREVEALAAGEHGLGERGRLDAIETVEETRHEERGHLVVRHVAAWRTRTRARATRPARCGRRRASARSAAARALNGARAFVVHREAWFHGSFEISNHYDCGRCRDRAAARHRRRRAVTIGRGAHRAGRQGARRPQPDRARSITTKRRSPPTRTSTTRLRDAAYESVELGEFEPNAERRDRVVPKRRTVRASRRRGESARRRRTLSARASARTQARCRWASATGSSWRARSGASARRAHDRIRSIPARCTSWACGTPTSCA